LVTPLGRGDNVTPLLIRDTALAGGVARPTAGVAHTAVKLPALKPVAKVVDCPEQSAFGVAVGEIPDGKLYTPTEICGTEATQPFLLIEAFTSAV